MAAIRPIVATGASALRAPTPTAGGGCHLDTCLSAVGVTERGGPNMGTEVEIYLRSTKLGGGYPWCSAFVHWGFRSCGTVHEPAREFAAAARWHRDGHIVFTRGHWERQPEGRRISQDGDLGTLWYNNLGRIGHVFVVAGEDDDYLLTVEGNTNSGGDREGEGVYRRKRLKRSVYSVCRWSAERDQLTR